MKDHFAILKVGPGLTFAMREALWALDAIDQELTPTHEQAHLRDVVLEYLDALTARQGPDFSREFVPNFMTNFSDAAHADALRQFAPAQETLGGRVMTSRALEAIAISADMKARVLPAIEAWIKAAPARP